MQSSVKSSSAKSSVKVWQGFRALSDPLRINIIELLRSQEYCVCDLCEQLNTSQSKLSFHLKNLKDANIVTARQEGRWMYYSLNIQQLTDLESYLKTLTQNQYIAPAKPCG